MNACNAMLMTSQIEGSPNVVKEALACNQCVVGVPVGDVHQLLQGIEGCHATSRDPREIGAALAAILAAGRRSNGREVMQQRGLSLESVAQRVISIYELALGTRSASLEPSIRG
jgi:glycosyltransferase involved in cell wall biosynthesis